MNIGRYNKFVKKLENNIKKLDNSFSHIILLCIGTDTLIGDAIGPIIGSNLKNLENEYIKVYGSIGNNLDFSNAKNTVEELYKKYNNPFIITIDAALSKEKKIGEIHISNGYIKIGNALEKSICFYSNVNIKCVVGKYNKLDKNDNISVLNNALKEDVYNMAEIVSKGIKNIFENINIYV